LPQSCPLSNGSEREAHPNYVSKYVNLLFQLRAGSSSKILPGCTPVPPRNHGPTSGPTRPGSREPASTHRPNEEHPRAARPARPLRGPSVFPGSPWRSLALQTAGSRWTHPRRTAWLRLAGRSAAPFSPCSTTAIPGPAGWNWACPPQQPRRPAIRHLENLRSPPAPAAAGAIHPDVPRPPARAGHSTSPGLLVGLDCEFRCRV